MYRIIRPGLLAAGIRSGAVHRPLVLPGLALLLSAWFEVGCDAPTSPRKAVPQNLISNGSFERFGEPTLATWRFGNPNLASAVHSSLPGHGTWSLRLDADWAPTLGFAYVSVPDAHPGDRLKLSAYVRAIPPDGGGVISIAMGRSLWERQVFSAGTAESTWTLVSVEAVASADPADSVWVVLSSPHTEVTQRSGLFDGVELIRFASAHPVLGAEPLTAQRAIAPRP